MRREGMTVREAAEEWVREFNAIQQGMIGKLMAYDPDEWQEVTQPKAGDRVYVYEVPEELDTQEHGGEIRSYDEESELYCIELDDGKMVSAEESDFDVERDGELPMWGTMWSFGDSCKERGWVSICDCCCGAGALLIGARNELLRKHFSPTNTLFVAQDIDRTAALMCYLQLSLLGCAGYVIVGNSLTNPMAGPTGSPLLITPSEGQEVWLMPALYDKAWAYRIQLEKLKLLMG